MTKKTILYKLLAGSFLFAVSFYIPMGSLLRVLLLFVISYLITLSVSDPSKGFMRQLAAVGLFVLFVGFHLLNLIIVLKALVIGLVIQR